MYDYWDGVDDGELVLEIDVMQTGPVYTLVGVAMKKDEDNVCYSCAASLGRKWSKRKLKEQDIKSVEALLKAVKQMVVNLKAKKLKTVKATSDEDESIEAISCHVLLHIFIFTPLKI